MARKEYLSYEERQRFDSPPILANMQRTIFIQLPDWAESYYKVLVTPTNQVGFLLQLEYFRIVCRFFDPLQFRPEDTAFIQKTGRNIDPNAVDMLTYKQSSSYYRHQQEILSHLGFESFSNQHQVVLMKEAKRLAHLQVKPANIVDSCMVYLRERRIEIPSYTILRSIIHIALSEYESDLEQILERHLQQPEKY